MTSELNKPSYFVIKKILTLTLTKTWTFQDNFCPQGHFTCLFLPILMLYCFGQFTQDSLSLRSFRYKNDDQGQEACCGAFAGAPAQCASSVR